MAQLLDDWLRRVRTSAPILLMLLAGALLLLTVPAPSAFVPPPDVSLARADDPAFARPDFDDSDWPAMSAWAISDLDGIAWVRWPVTEAEQFGDVPLALEMNGPFSAEIFWNGVLVGTKGEVGRNARSERAGPIDYLVAIPDELVRPGDNLVALRIASNRAGYRPAAIVQSLRLAVYRPDARRSLRYYALAVGLAGALAALAAGFAYFAHLRRDPRLAWLTLALAGLLVADAAEVSRALVNYPYDWHQPRQIIVLAGLVLFAGALIRFLTTRWPGPDLPRRLFLAACLAAGAVPALFARGYDAKSGWAMVLMLSLAALWWIWRAWRETPALLVPAVALGALPVYAYLLPGDFLDRGIYLMGAVFFALVLLGYRDQFAPVADGDGKRAMLALQTSGRRSFVPLDDVRYLKAAGNYTEVHAAGARWHLDNRGLATLLDALPDRFERIHKSYAADLDKARAIKSAAGSRYTLELDDGTDLPISRSKVAALREKLSG